MFGRVFPSSTPGQVSLSSMKERVRSSFTNGRASFTPFTNGPASPSPIHDQVSVASRDTRVSSVSTNRQSLEINMSRNGRISRAFSTKRITPSPSYKRISPFYRNLRVSPLVRNKLNLSSLRGKLHTRLQHIYSNVLTPLPAIIKRITDRETKVFKSITNGRPINQKNNTYFITDKYGLMRSFVRCFRTNLSQNITDVTVYQNKRTPRTFITDTE